MNVNDIICLGARPLFFLDYIACGVLDLKVLKDLMKGIRKGLALSDCELLGGETAEMPGMYSKDEYDLAGFCVGVVDRRKIINASSIKAGDIVIGISSSGLHSNGFSLVRKALGKKGIKNYSQDLLIPTRIYVKAILSLLSSSYSSKVNGIAHVTGGAFYNKITKILPKGTGIVINKNSWKTPAIFKVVQSKANLDDKEMYTVFNMGIGMVLVVKKGSEKGIANYLNKFYKTFIIGEVKSSGKKMVLL